MTDSRALRRAAAIVGAAETARVDVQPDRSELSLHAEAALAALADAGLSPADVDGLATAGPRPSQIAEYLGIVPRWVDGTAVGGCSFLVHVGHAAAAIAAGYASTVLITHGESGRSRVGVERRVPSPATPWGQFEMPYGVYGPPTMFSLPVVRHMARYGSTEEQFAAVAVATRRWAALNPRATMRTPISVEDVLASRLIAWPLRLLNCCLVTDAGGAVVVVGGERARDFPRPPVWLLGRGEAVAHQNVSQMADFSESEAYRVAGMEAFRMAGVGPAEIGHAMLYDAFTHTPVYMLEALGFVDRGEGGPFFAEMRTAPGGELPVNTNGGGLSHTHTGMYGMFAIVESVVQLRGDGGARQVEGVELSLAHGAGGMFAAGATLILTNQP